MKRINTNLTPEVRRNILHATMHSCMQLNTVYSMITVYMHGHVLKLLTSYVRGESSFLLFDVYFGSHTHVPLSGKKFVCEYYVLQ